MRAIVFKTWLAITMLTGFSLPIAWGQESVLLDDVKIPLLAQADAVPEAAPEVSVVPDVADPPPAEPAVAEPILEPVTIPEPSTPAPVEAVTPVELLETPPATVVAPIEQLIEEPATPAAPVEAAAPVEETAPVEAAAPAMASNEAAKFVAQQVEVRKREQQIKAQKALAEAQSALQKRRYTEAATLFQQAVSTFPVLPSNAQERLQASNGLSEAQYYLIQSLIQEDKLKEAFDMATEASARDPENRKIERALTAVNEEIEDQKARAKREQERIAADPSRGVEVKTIHAKVDRLIREGRGFLAIGDVKTAADKFGSALSLEPENRTAMRYLEKTGHKRFASSTAEFKATSGNMVADVRDAWNPRDYVYVAPEVSTNKPAGSEYGAKLMEKMEKIMIPSIEFRQANIHDVVDFLVKASIAEDIETAEVKDKGVNIILNLGTAAGSSPVAPAAAADPFAPVPAAGGASMSGVPEITFTARYISLMQAIKIITSVAGLKYRIEDKIVMIVPADAPEGEIVHKWYSVEPTFLQVIQNMAPAGGAEGGGGSVFDTGLNTHVQSNRGDVEDFFRRMGVEMPKGSSVLYQPTIGKLIVANTSRNLAVVERILQEINVVPKQVEIEARFVEVNQSDLEELGFQWMLNDNWEVLTKKGGGAMPGGNQRIQINKNSGTGGFTSGMRFWDNTVADLKGTASGAMGSIMTVQSVLTNPELSMVLHLMEQNGHADVLSAPKVTTRSGSEATMRVVTEYIYPTEFDIRSGTDLTGNTGNTDEQNVEAKVVALPQNFETREVGVILSVIPEVSPEGNMINLNMRPEVVSDPTWHEYGVTLPDSNGNEYEVRMPQPFFHRRSVETQISIYDGATVVMGGLITEKLVTINDKIPFLGDIPLIGALFRNKGSNSEKRNLMIFVTARLVDPAGKPIRSQKAEDQTPVLGVPAAAAASTATP